MHAYSKARSKTGVGSWNTEGETQVHITISSL